MSAVVRPALVVRTTWAKKTNAYMALTKPRIIEQLLITTVPAMVLAQRGLPDLWLILATIVGGTLAAGGASAVNMWYDRDIDAVMKRTANRPLVQGTLTAREALIFGITLELVAALWLAEFVNPLSSVLAVSGALFYIFVYTIWLKRSSPANIVIGGAAGAVPVLVGWAAVVNRIDIAPMVMFAIIFFWTPPHFWALAFKYRSDYVSAKVPMLPAVASDRYTTLQIFAYTVLLWALSLLLTPLAQMGWFYGISAVVLGGIFTMLAVQLMRDHSEQRAMRLFHYSITYVTLLFSAVAVDQFVHFS